MTLRLHREGRNTLLITGFVFCLTAILLDPGHPIILFSVLAACLVVYLLLLNFFRNPMRPIPTKNDHLVYAPADGKVVAIEETQESEYFRDNRIQVSVFMSPLNVHVNRIPFSGRIAYQKYHAGKYLVAFHPKSSTENERNTVVVENQNASILLRQIAGAVARRIVWYINPGDQVAQGQEFGFIKFGSRVDVFLPLDAKINVHIGDKVKGNITVLAEV